MMSWGLCQCVWEQLEPSDYIWRTWLTQDSSDQCLFNMDTSRDKDVEFYDAQSRKFK